jgi:hypothetical protein
MRAFSQFLTCPGSLLRPPQATGVTGFFASSAVESGITMHAQRAQRAPTGRINPRRSGLLRLCSLSPSVDHQTTNDIRGG